MNCREFQESINDFIFDKIEYANDVEAFIKHFKECKNCNEDLRLYYMVRRGLGDIECPLIDEKPKDANEELDLIMSYYDDHFHKQRLRTKILVIAGFAIGIAVIVLSVLFALGIIEF